MRATYHDWAAAAFFLSTIAGGLAWWYWPLLGLVAAAAPAYSLALLSLIAAVDARRGHWVAVSALVWSGSIVIWLGVWTLSPLFS